MKPKLSSGQDLMSSKLLKETAFSFVNILTSLMNKSLAGGWVPQLLKLAKVVPIHKAGLLSDTNNYRPISLLSTYAKLLEKLVAPQLLWHLNSNNILSNCQFGFRTQHSTIHPVVLFSDYIYKAHLEKEYVISIFIDLKKAFDTVDHHILLRKLQHYGIHGVALDWFSSYLTNRQQFVKLDDTNSMIMSLACGVPQGSVLGPILFLLFINDMPESISLRTLLFADDTTYQGRNKDPLVLQVQINSQLDIANTWFCCNKLSLNISKTRYMVFTPPSANKTVTFDIRIGDSQIERISNLSKIKAYKFVGLWIVEN